MKVRVEKTDQPQMYLIIFDEKKAVFPTEPVVYENAEQARRDGFYAIRDIFSNGKVSSVQAGQLDSVDMFAVFLKDGETWGDPASSASDAHSVKIFIQKFITDNEAVYQNPKEARIPSQKEVDDFIAQRSEIATSPFNTIKKDGGSISAKIDRNDRSIHLEFNGKCITENCPNGSSLTTKRRVGHEFRQLAPGLGIHFTN